MRRISGRTGRFTFAVSIISVGGGAWANTGVQLPLSQYSAGSEQTTLVPNGNFSARTEDPPTSGQYPIADGWTRISDTTGGMFVNPTSNPPSNSAATSPYSAQATIFDPVGNPPPGDTRYSYNQFVDKSSLDPNGNYVLSAYVWNYGVHDPSMTGTGDLASIKIVDPAFELSSVSATLESQGSNGQTASTGRLMYILFNESQVRNWSSIEVRAEAQVGQIAGTRPNLLAQFDNVSITPVNSFAAQQWTSTSGGNWSSSGNWLSGIVANFKGSVASLGQSASPQNITLDTPVFIGVLKLDSTAPYSLSGNTLTLIVSEDGFHNFQGVPEVNVVAGNHTITAPIVFDVTPDTNHPTPGGWKGAFTVATGASVNMTNVTATNVQLAKHGGGTANVNHVRAESVAVDGGVLRVAQNGTSTGTSVVNGVAASDGGQLDLMDNKLIVKAGDVGTWDGSAYTGVTGLVQSGRGNGTWNGSGIVTSMTDATSGVLTSLAVALAEDVGYAGGTFGGQSVVAGDVLVMYTWGGDAQMDGDLDGDDYFQIDSNVAQSGSVFGYENGDFNYDGLINGDDYFIIDSNIAFAQSQPPFPTAGGAALAAVPEPSVAALMAAAACALPLRRRRRA